MKLIGKKTIKNAVKVAWWEFKKLTYNKSFVISLILTPIIMALAIMLPPLIGGDVEDDYAITHIYVMDEIGIFEALSQTVGDVENLTLQKHVGSKGDLEELIRNNLNAGYLHLTNEIFEKREAFIVTEKPNLFVPWEFRDALETTLMHFELAKFNVDFASAAKIIAGYSISALPSGERAEVLPERAEALPEGAEVPRGTGEDGDLLQPPPAPPELEQSFFGVREEEAASAIRKWAAPGFAMLVYFMILFSGMTTMQSAMADKSDKMVEILLSSVSAASLMYGKIIGNFLSGLVQIAVYAVYGVIIMYVLGVFAKIGISFHQLFFYIFVPELPLLLTFALLGYLISSALYVGLGSTMDDIQSAGNFQGIVMMVPIIPVFLVTPVVMNPEGTVAQVASYIPFTSAVVMILRMTLLELSLLEIILPLLVLLVSTMIMAKLAGKIFKTGMLMYGKGIDIKEMWKWVRQ